MENEENLIAVQVNGEFACQTFPLLDESKIIYATREELDAIGTTKCFDLERLMVVDYDNTKEVKINEIKAKISELKANLDATDYKAIKYAEGVLSAEEYEETKQLREDARKQINMLEEELKLYE